MNRASRPRLSRISGSSYASKLLGRAGDGSTLSLDFTTGVLDPRLVFTRASDATFINSSGLVQWADANHVQNSTMLNNTGTKWTQTTSGGTVTINGDGTVRFNGTGGRATWLQSIASLASGLPMTFSFRVTSFTNTNLRTTDLFNAGTGFTGQSYFYTDTTGTTHTLTAFESLPKSGTNGVGTYSVTATTNATSANIIFGSDCNGVGGRSGDVTITEPQLQYGTVVPRRVYVPNSSIIAAKWDSARFDYDPTTLAPRGLLIEGQATNLLQQSADWTVSPWSKPAQITWDGTTYATAPDGTNTAKQVTVTVGSSASVAQGIANATNRTVSLWLRAGSLTTFSVGAFDSTGGTTWGNNADSTCRIISGPGSVSQQVGGLWSVTGLSTTQWTRVEVFRSSSYGALLVYPGGTGTVTGTAFMWGMQMEAGNGASSLIPTGASTGSRAADSCVMTGTNFSSWFAGAVEGVLYAEFERPRSQSGTIGHDHTAVGSQYASGSAFAVYSAASVYYPTTFLWPTGGAIFPGGIASAIPSVSKQAGKWFNGNDATNFANGVQGTTTAGTGTLTPTMLSLGANSGTGTQATRDWLNACVRRVKFWPVALPDSQIISITT
jgi:hypothetical protein